MDQDKDGIISASDLKAAFASVGKSISDSDASSMLAEAPGPVNFTQLVTLFAEKMAGGNDQNNALKKLQVAVRPLSSITYSSLMKVPTMTM